MTTLSGTWWIIIPWDCHSRVGHRNWRSISDWEFFLRSAWGERYLTGHSLHLLHLRVPKPLQQQAMSLWPPGGNSTPLFGAEFFQTRKGVNTTITWSVLRFIRTTRVGIQPATILKGAKSEVFVQGSVREHFLHYSPLTRSVHSPLTKFLATEIMQLSVRRPDTFREQRPREDFRWHDGIVRI